MQSIPEIKLDGVIEHTTLSVPNLFQTITSISGKLTVIPSTLENCKGHGHKYMVMSDAEYVKLDGVLAPVDIPDHPGEFLATTAATTGKYQKESREYLTHETVESEAREFLKKAFYKTGVIYDLEAHDGSITKTPYEIIEHLWDQIPKREKQRAVNTIEKSLDNEWDRDEPVQKYMRELQDAKWQLTQLKSDPGTPKIIRKVVCSMEQHLDMDKSVREWDKKSSPDKKKWDECKKHFQRGLREVENNPAYKKQVGYANKVQEEKMEEMKDTQRFLAQQLIDHQKEFEQYKENAAQNAMQLKQQLQEAKTSNTTQKDVKEMTEKERKKYYFDMFSATQSTNPVGKKKGFYLNNMKGGERSVRRFPESTIYCWSCGFDLKPNHLDNGGCKWKRPGHKDEATIENRMGGSTRNCFHHPNWETLKNN